MMKMNDIVQLEIEVEKEANKRSLEVLFLLIDRMEIITSRPDVSLQEVLNYYINLKLCKHRLKKRFFDWGIIDSETYYSQFNNLTDRIKKARHKYYDTKRRYEDDRDHQHSLG